MKTSFISVIMPVYNGEAFVQEAIDSLIAQDYPNWELLVINDGSTDGTAQILNAQSDQRVTVFHQENRGVSAARNVGFAAMKGDYFCFLDADDRITKTSLTKRLAVFEADDSVFFVDGAIEKFDNVSGKITEKVTGSFYGYPFSELIRLNGQVFFGPSWMVRVNPERTYRMKEGMTHAEDLLFYSSIASDGRYTRIPDVVLEYRVANNSAMTNLTGLEQGYIDFIEEVGKMEATKSEDLAYLMACTKRIMVRSYIKSAKMGKALKVNKRWKALSAKLGLIPS